ncbi:unnamed protein product [Schistocephalus solidus]|uniref:Reverse transcriptase domain-containing protein n=1 Tax=Schistocephalus solidus TaxID=70667 RepID=A0A183SAM2_SCHSO|nr:unnamed protein product [Schistocephalus solidus]
MNTMLINVPGNVAYLDDILVVGQTDKEMLQRLDRVMENLIEYGLKINVEKSEQLRKEINYLGCFHHEGYTNLSTLRDVPQSSAAPCASRIDHNLPRLPLVTHKNPYRCIFLNTTQAANIARRFVPTHAIAGTTPFVSCRLLYLFILTSPGLSLHLQFRCSLTTARSMHSLIPELTYPS